jgi:hypothetical protein
LLLQNWTDRSNPRLEECAARPTTVEVKGIALGTQHPKIIDDFDGRILDQHL